MPQTARVKLTRMDSNLGDTSNAAFASAQYRGTIELGGVTYPFSNERRGHYDITGFEEVDLGPELGGKLGTAISEATWRAFKAQRGEAEYDIEM